MRTAPAGRTPEQVRDQLHRRRVRPVQVVDREHERTPAGEAVEQAAHGAVGAVPLGWQRHRRVVDQPGQRREHAGQLVELEVQWFELVTIQRGEVVVERIDEDAEGFTLLELGRPSREDEVAVLLRLGAELGDQAGLPDALLARDLDHAGRHPRRGARARPSARHARPASQRARPSCRARHRA